MPWYSIIHDVLRASGTETWKVEAENEKAARILHEQGKSEFIAQDVEVTSLGEPEIRLEE